MSITKKENEAIEILKSNEPPEGYYVTYSGGKDSTVILDLVRRSGVKYDAHYNITTIDPPELVYHIRKQSDIIWEKPKMSMWELIPHKLMPPTRLTRYCCEVLKEHGGSGRTVITGIRAAESTRRSKRQKFELANKDKTKKLVHIIFDWSTDEVWEYIHSHKLEYCSLYDEGFKRLGCICCPLAGWKKQLAEAERWPKYKDLYLMAFDKMLKHRIELGKYVTWQNAQEVWDWWTAPPVKKPKETENNE